MFKSPFTSVFKKQSRYDVGLLLVCLVLVVSCKSPGTQPRINTEIISVKISDDPVTTNFATKLEVILQDSLSETQRIAWRFQQPDGSYQDSLTQTATFFWVAPNQPGEYKHNLWIETEEGETISKVTSIALEVVPWAEPRNDLDRSIITFSSRQEKDQTFQIYTVDINGENLTRLTDWDKGSDNPSWSSDGRYIIYSSFFGGTSHNEAFWTMNVNGANNKLLRPGSVAPLRGRYPRWNPKNKNIIAFHFYTGLKFIAYLFDIESDRLIRVVGSSTNEYLPTWSPDGNRLAFWSESNARTALYIVNIDGTGLNKILEVKYHFPIVWSPDGTRIVFRQPEGASGIYEYNLLTGEIVQLINDSSSGGKIIPYSWSPDRSRLLLGISPLYSSETGLFILNTITDTLHKVIDMPFEVLGADWYVP